MSDKPKPGGYIDNAALGSAIEANEALARLLSEIADHVEPLSRTVALELQRAAFELVRQRGALAQMEVIRAQSKNR